MNSKRYSGVIVKHKDKCLLCKRNNLGSFPGMWSIPGGKIEDEEETLSAAKREFFEETNINIDDQELEFVGVLPRHTRDGKKVKGMMYVYLLDSNDSLVPDLKGAKDGDEHTECDYFSEKQLDSSKMGEFLYKMIENILKRKK
jgi:8-oxo-dGTP pyrophosphatase MutT (NUDIX family)